VRVLRVLKEVRDRIHDLAGSREAGRCWSWRVSGRRQAGSYGFDWSVVLISKFSVVPLAAFSRGYFFVACARFQVHEISIFPATTISFRESIRG
jgi:hypothetical protein